MIDRLKRRLAPTALCGATLLFSAAGGIAQPLADPAGRDAARWELVAAPYTLHFRGGDDHKYVWLLGLERPRPDGSLWGGAVFNNTFGQPSGYLYYGHTWDDLFGRRGWYFKLTGGVVYGYTGKYRNRVPYNHGGFAPAIIPGLGYRFSERDAVQVSLLGFAGLMFSYNRRF